MAGGGIEVAEVARFDEADARAAAWVEASRAARTVCVIEPGRCVVRSVQLPTATEDRLASALELNANAFILGRTPPWRVGWALLARERGAGIRTGIVAEWPEDDRQSPLPGGLRESANVSFSPDVAALAALSAHCDDPMVAVDASTGTVTVCVPTSKGLLARSIRTGAEGSSIDRGDVARAVGEACVSAGTPPQEAAEAVVRATQVAESAIGGGLGLSPGDVARLASVVRGTSAADPVGWWREHGIAAGTAMAAFGPAAALTRMQSHDLGAKPDRAGRLLNLLAAPGVARRLLVAAVLAIALAPPALEGARLLMLRWKLPDLAAYQAAEDVDRKRQALYRVLSRQGASMTKVLSDLACCAPDGVDIDFVNVAAAARGPAVTVRGKVRPSGNRLGVEVLIEFERHLRESGAFDAISRSSEAPDARGYQEFTVNAVAIRPTTTVAFPEEQDFAKTSMRVRRYGPPPDDVDPVASGIEAGAARGAKDAATAVADSPSGGDAPAAAGAADSSTASAAAAESGAVADGGKAPEPRAGRGADARSTRASASTGSSSPGRGLATRSNPGATSEPEPLPPPMSATEIDSMSKQEAQDALTRISKFRSRADLSDADKARLKAEFNLLLDRCAPQRNP
ncbi:MAG: hypothetical protein FJ306_09525 [Planctomycetes bacterium]|nr:hypothetical protein [Planctomycetota bacterium]